MPTIADEFSIWSVPEGHGGTNALTVLLHGNGGHESDMQQFVDILPPTHTLVSLRAPYRHGSGYSWLGAVTDQSSLATELDEAALEVLRWIDAHRGEASHVGLIGWSQGGAVALQALRIAPAVPAFVVTLGGFTGGSFRAQDADLARRRPPLFWGHGDEDDVIPPEDIAAMTGFLPGHVTPTNVEYHHVGHEITEPMRADVSRFVSALERRR